ncbi:TPA: hypothetical protein DDW35_10500, partial [Candidatus Sumerlaeota bacterium]|nr:hypothetical protein [Candidatus Sumerlaeota bacterium]
MVSAFIMTKKIKRLSLPIRHPLSWSLRVWMWLFVIVVSAAAGASIGAFFGYLQKLSPVEKMENYNPAQQTRVYDWTGDKQIASYSQKREFVPQSKIPDRLKKAFIAIEDERFYEHCGVDPWSIGRIVSTFLTTGRRQGASTLTMQLARDVVLGNSKKTITRKIQEVFAAVHIEQRYSKDQILEFYLNQFFAGSNSYGVQAAAKTYFGKEINDLTVAECATLAALPQRPSVVNPFANPGATEKRRNKALGNMKRLSFIDEDTYNRAMAEPLVTTSRTLSTSEENPYFMSLVRSALSFDKDLRSNILYHGGYQVYTTMNPTWQKIVEEEVAKGLPEVEKQWQERKTGRLEWEQRSLLKKKGTLEPQKGQVRLAKILEVRDNGVMVQLEGYKAFAEFRREWVMPPEDPADPEKKRQAARTGDYIKPWLNPNLVLKRGQLIDVLVKSVEPTKHTIDIVVYDDAHIQAAAVLLDVHTGNIVAISGGSNYSTPKELNRAISAYRQPGSSFKPLLYATAMQHGRTPATIIKDEQPFEINGFKVKNYDNELLEGATLIYALKESDNVVTVKLFSELGMKTVLPSYRKFNIMGAAGREKPWTLNPELSLCLGSLSVTPLSIAAAYLPLARNDGIVIEPTCIQRITDLNNQSNIELPTPKRNIVLSPESAYLTTRMLREVVKTGTGKEVGKEFSEDKYPEMAGKTGTTNNCVDAWFVGYTPDLVLAVWTGMDNNTWMG